MPYSPNEIRRAILDTIKANRLKACYIRPIAFIGYGEMGIYAKNNPTVTAVACWPWGSYLGEEGMKKGIRVRVSSFTRHHVNVSPPRAKATGYYINSQRAGSTLTTSPSSTPTDTWPRGAGEHSPSGGRSRRPASSNLEGSRGRA
jgi:branched-chain amino acid aminotransferase